MKNAHNAYNSNITRLVILKQSSQQHTVYMDWWYKDKWFYKFSRTVNAVLLWLTVILNAVIIYGNFYRISDYSKGKNTINQTAALKNSTYSFILGTLLLILGFIFFKKAQGCKNSITAHKTKALTAFVIETLGCAVSAVTAVSALLTNRLSNMYATSVDGATLTRINLELYGYHIVPLAIILITALLMFVMLYKDSKERESLYKEMTGRIYKEYIKKNPNYTEEMWNEYLDNYDPSDEK